MSKCMRNGVMYKRHKWGREKATPEDTTIYGLAINEVPVCIHCGQIWGEQGAFCVQRDQESEDEDGTREQPGSSVCGVFDGGGSVPVSAGDSGEGDDVEGGAREETKEEVN